MKILELPNNELLTTDKFTKLTAIDVSEQPIERPLDKQESYYSGKKTTYYKVFAGFMS